MKTGTAFQLLASTLILIVIMGTVTASPGTFETGKSGIISGYKSSPGYSRGTVSSTYTGVVKPDFTVNPTFAATIFWDPAFMNQTRQAAVTGTQSSFAAYSFLPKWRGSCCSCG